MEMYNSFDALARANTTGLVTDNAVFVGEFDPLKKYGASQFQDDIEALEKVVFEMRKRVIDAVTAVSESERQMKQEQANSIIRNFIATHRDKYALLKKALLDAGIETISDIRQFDEYYAQKYGGDHEN